MANITQSRKQSKSKATPKVAGAEFDKSRARLDKKKLVRDQKTHWAHFWNVCPKCGGDMFEQTVLKIRLEVCRDCHGIYIDAAELTLALKHIDPKKWLGTVLQRSKHPKAKI